jgi:hypothetical protein
VERLALLDGGAPMKTTQRLKVMRFLLKSLERVGVFYPDAAGYLAAARQSPIITEWTEVLEAHLLYELVRERGKVRCSILPSVMEEELRRMGGGLTFSGIAKRMARSPLQSLRRLRTVFPYEKIRCPVFIIKAGRHNLTPGDDLISYAALDFMLGRFHRASAAVIADLNHYEMVLKKHAWRDALLRDYLLHPIS